MQNIRSKIRLVLGTALVATLPVSTAYAGFEWTPPATQKANPPAMNPLPTADVQSEVLPSVEPQNLPTVEQAIKAPEPVQSEPVEQFPARDYKVVQGFGSDIPLILVMNQIVPSRYSYSFDDTVNQGMRVSWNGGKPWNIVLEEALEKHGYGIMIVDDVVWVRDEIYPEPQNRNMADNQALPAAHVPTAPTHTLPVDMTAGGMSAPPAPSMPNETATAMNVEQKDELAPVPLMIEEDQPRTQSEEYNPSYPRRVPPQIDRSDATPKQYGAANVEAPQESSSMPVPLMPFKKAEPKAQDAEPTVRKMGMHPQMQSSPMKPQASQQRDAKVMQPTEPLPVVPAIPSTAQAGSPQVDTKAAEGPVLDPFEIIYWRAQKGEKLRSVLKRWSDEANVALIWNAAYDYEMPDDIAMHGTFPDVISQTLMRFSGSEPRPVGKLHPNLPSGPSVLSVDTYTTAATN